MVIRFPVCATSSDSGLVCRKQGPGILDVDPLYVLEYLAELVAIKLDLDPVDHGKRASQSTPNYGKALPLRRWRNNRLLSSDQCREVVRYTQAHSGGVMAKALVGLSIEPKVRTLVGAADGLPRGLVGMLGLGRHGMQPFTAACSGVMVSSAGACM
jgi:hypothetical protein